MAADPSYDIETGTLVLDRDHLTALGRAGRGAGSAAETRELGRMGLLIGNAVAPSLETLAQAIAAPRLRVNLTMRMRGRRVDGYGWVDETTTVVAVPPPDQPGAPAFVFSTPTSLLAHRVAAFVGLGPRPAEHEEGVLALRRDAFERVVAQAGRVGDPRVELELDEGVPHAWLGSLVADGALHWHLRLSDSQSDGGRFDRHCEVLDSNDRGLWLISAAPHGKGMLAVVTATATSVWVALSTMLPTDAEAAELSA